MGGRRGRGDGPRRWKRGRVICVGGECFGHLVVEGLRGCLGGKFPRGGARRDSLEISLMRKIELESLECRVMLSAAVATVVIDGVKYRGVTDMDEGERILVPVKPQMVKPAAASKAAMVAMAASNASISSGFMITLNLTGSGVSQAITDAFNAAKAKWEGIITGVTAAAGSVDNVQIDATISPIDGVGKILGQAGPTALQSSTLLPTKGVMQFDSADLTNLAASGSLGDVVFHEMGHVLGFGTVWATKHLSGGTAADPRFLGTNAISAYQALGGTALTVPLENVGGAGTAGAHWRESIFSNEVMTGYLNSGINPVSTITIASMADLGYSVDASKYEAYTIPGVIPSTANAGIVGNIYIDADKSGSKDGGEAAAASKTVYIDSNGNGKYDAGERATASKADGTYSILNLQPGTYTVRVNAVGTLSQTSSALNVTLVSLQTSSGNDIGVFDSAASVAGVVYLDKDNSGTKDTGELVGVKMGVFIDANSNGKYDVGEKAVTTGTDGSYSFAGLVAGTYSVRVMLSGNLVQSSGASVTLVEGQALTGNNLGAFDQSSIVTGTVFGDANNNGIQEPGELGLGARGVFLDTNNNGKADAGERAATTSANGMYVFTGVAPGTYNVRPFLTADTTLENTTTNFSVVVGAALTVNSVNRGLHETAGSVTGVVFNDLSNDGVKDSGEAGLAGRVVFFDVNGNGLMEKTERATVTNAQGTYTFTAVRPGSYAVKVVPAVVGMIQTTTNAVMVGTAESVTSVDVGSFNTNATITGTVYNDLSNDGVKDSGELAAAGKTVFLDTNNNSKIDAGEKSAVTTTAGTYTFGGIVPGTYNVRVFLTADSTLVSTVADPSVTVAAGATASAVDRGLYDTAGSIVGTVFNDLSNDGVKDSGEASLAGRVVYIDVNGNGLLDKGERAATTNVLGAFGFSGIKPGTYSVRVTAAIAGMIQSTTNSVTVGVAQAVTGVDLGSFNTNATITGTIYNDLSNDGTRDTGELPLAGKGVYLDANNNSKIDAGEKSATTNSLGVYSFTGVTAGTYNVRIFLTSDSTLVPTVADPSITVAAGATASGVDRGLYDTAGSIAGNVFNDLSNDGVKDAGEAGLAGRVVFFDANGNNLLDKGERFVTTGANGVYLFAGVKPGTYSVRVTAPAAGLIQSTTNSVTVGVAQAVTGNDVGSFDTNCSVAGTLYNDLNNNGTRDAGEVGLVKVGVYADANGNGKPDTGEKGAITGADGSFTIGGIAAGSVVIRSILGANVAQTTDGSQTLTAGQKVTGLALAAFDSNCTISGNVFMDPNQSGTKDAGELAAKGLVVYLDANNNSVFDKGEVYVATGADGNYSFAKLVAGTYNVRVVAPAGLTQVAPAAAGANAVTVTPGQVATGNVFALFDTTGIILGSIFFDANGNGTRDAGEVPLKGQTAYLDMNGNGKLDAGERTALSSAAGSYVFAAVPAGGYSVRVFVPTGTTQTVPAAGAAVATTVTAGAVTTAGALGLGLAGAGHVNAGLFSSVAVG